VSAMKWMALVLAVWISPLAHATMVEYVHTDGLGSVVAVSNAAGQVIERREYEPYGHQLTPALADGPGYTGHVQDAATGLTYMQQRYFDPELGLFLSIDPVTAYESPVGHFNLYRYANSNPFANIDPDGRACNSLSGGGCGMSVSGEMVADPAAAMATMGTIADFLPVVGPIKAVGEAILDPTPSNFIGAAVSVLPVVGPVGRNALKSVPNKADGYVDLVSPRRRRHILDGDATGGGHRPGTGISGKSEFPQGWSDDRILHNISDVATDPSSVTRAGRGGRTITDGTRDGINIRVIQERNGDIVTGFPTNVPRNP